MNPTLRSIALGFILTALSVHAALVVPSIFNDGMVLQRDRAIPVWGWAEPGARVAVEFAAFKADATAGADGRWETQLPAQPASASGRDLIIQAGNETRRLRYVLIGDVWLLAGQSNMGWSVNQSAEAVAAKARANYPWLRAFVQLPMEGAADQPALDVKGGKWQACSPASVGNWSAVGFYFAEALQPHLEKNVPVALIHTAMGGTAIESWIDLASLESLPAGRIGAKFYRDQVGVSLKKNAEWYAAKAAWQKQADAAKAAGQPAPALGESLAKEPAGLKYHNLPSVLFNGKVAPIQPFALRGVVWYQGEGNAANTDAAKRYADLLPLMIERWRAGFRDPALPFLIVQLPGHNPTAKQADWPEMRAQQAAVCARVPATALVVTLDLGERDNIHPTHKQPVGERAALAARKLVYGESALADQGPRYLSAARTGSAIRITLSHTGALSTRDAAAPTGFAVAGADGNAIPAAARIEGDAIVVTVPATLQGPVTVSYAWKNWPEANVADATGMPLTAFRTPAQP
jgi:sialate O-acetylesterase